MIINMPVLSQGNEFPSRALLIVYTGSIVWFGHVWQGLGFQTPVAHWLILATVLPLIWQIAGLELSLLTARQRIVSLLATLGVSRKQYLVADVAVLITLFCLLALVPTAILLGEIGLPAFCILPIGAFPVLILVSISAAARKTHLPILPKLIAAAWFLIACVVWVDP